MLLYHGKTVGNELIIEKYVVKSISSEGTIFIDGCYDHNGSGSNYVETYDINIMGDNGIFTFNKIELLLLWSTHNQLIIDSAINEIVSASCIMKQITEIIKKGGIK